jgi:hypothetical protein
MVVACMTDGSSLSWTAPTAHSGTSMPRKGLSTVSSKAARTACGGRRCRATKTAIAITAAGCPIRRGAGIIRAMEECFPRSARQRCLAHRMRNLAAKAPTDLWPEFKTRVAACYQAPSRAIAGQLAAGIRADYADVLPSAFVCFDDDFGACIAHMRVSALRQDDQPARTAVRRGAAKGSKSSPTASAKSRCSNSCSARSSALQSDGAACASPSSSCARSPPSERNSTRNMRTRSRRWQCHPSPAFPANPPLDPTKATPNR